GVLAHVHDETTGGDVWRYTLTGESPTRLTHPPSHNGAPLWSPDGTGFAFAREEPAGYSIYRRRLDATAGEELLFGPKPTATPTSWSRDGKYLFVSVVDRATAVDVWVVPLTGDRTPRPVFATNDYEAAARLSPDGKWLAYMVGGGGTRPNVFLEAFP